MKTLFLLSVCYYAVVCVNAQSIVGRWQLIKQSNCGEAEIGETDAESEALLADMKGMSGATPQVLTLKDNNSGEESTKIIDKKKNYNSKSFLYKSDASTLYFLDKKSHTIIENFSIEKLTTDSLIISNLSRACETRIFVRIK